MTKLSQAICFATEVFDGTFRKAEECPAIFHSLEAASITQSVYNDEDAICAAVLHDTIEDGGVELETIKEKFGERVAALVSSETENKYREKKPSETWLMRKENSLKVLREATDIGVRAIWLGDKLSNMRSCSRLKKRFGDDMWNFFNQKDPKAHKKYHDSIAKELEVFSDTFAYKQYVFLLKEVFGEE